MRGTGCESPPHMLGNQMRATTHRSTRWTHPARKHRSRYWMRATRRPTHWTHPARELQIEALDARQWTHHARDPRSRHWTHHARHWMPGTGCQSPHMLSIPHSSIRVSHAMHRLFFQIACFQTAVRIRCCLTHGSYGVLCCCCYGVLMLWMLCP